MQAGSILEIRKLMNYYGGRREPFLFLVDFPMRMPEIYPLESIPDDILFSTPLLSASSTWNKRKENFRWYKKPVSFDIYLKAFRNVQSNIKLGNTYLLNLTFPTEIDTDLSLREIYDTSIARYKLLYKDKFVLFSPEIFARIYNGKIYSYPMKGTIDASVRDAENVILKDEKEMAEHDTIVDLIRNDLSIVSDNVQVTRYRYIDTIETNGKTLLQVSSEISGELQPDYMDHLGDIIFPLLPAGSVTGAPKKETIRIIRENEICERGWYTGIFGVFDGNELDSGVMIRFIEKSDGKLLFKSGGGITYMSDPQKEYEELISKVYVPLG
jgi:para-aminobenzoate synthetase component I